MDLTSPVIRKAVQPAVIIMAMPKSCEDQGRGEEDDRQQDVVQPAVIIMAMPKSCLYVRGQARGGDESKSMATACSAASCGHHTYAA